MIQFFPYKNKTKAHKKLLLKNNAKEKVKKYGRKKGRDGNGS